MAWRLTIYRGSQLAGMAFDQNLQIHITGGTMMRTIHLALIFLVGWAIGAFAQMESGLVRINPDFNFTAMEDVTEADVSLMVAYSVIDHLEVGISAGAYKFEGIDTFGGVSAATIFHILPGLPVVPGVGAGFGSTFGMVENSLVADGFFNLEAFATEQWAFTFRAGYERWFNDYADLDGFSARFGVSTFLGRD